MKLQANGYMTFNDYLMMYMARWKRISVVLLFLWIVVTYYVISPLRCAGGTDDSLDYEDRLKTVTAELEHLKAKHNNLIKTVISESAKNGEMTLDFGALLGSGSGPTEDYESLRRRIYTNTKDLWNFLSNQVSKALYEQNADQLPNLIKQIAERKRSLISDHQYLERIDGHHEWREREAANVSDLIQRRLKYLQNPADCREARKVVCNLNKGCGFGCQLHNIVYCLIFAYATERTLILNSKGWRYNSKGWEYVFLPLSDTCTSIYDDKPMPYPVTQDSKVISLPFVDSMMHKPKFLPLAVPRDLASRIVRFNGDPASWWIGQFVKFVLRPQRSLQKTLNESIAKTNFKNPIVGVHIRRTDKVGTEAAFHHIHEYMAHVKDYYDTLELSQKVDVRRVYLATDESNVLVEARAEYPNYEFIGDADIAHMAASHRRYTPTSLAGLLVDLTMLARADYLVCTFSSQVGRVAYELMQSNRVDASDSVSSLDDIFYFGGQNAHDRVAVMAHTAVGPADIDVSVGDMIGIAGNHWNGYGRGTNRRTSATGLIPWFKTTDVMVLYDFPIYEKVPLYEDTRQT